LYIDGCLGFHDILVYWKKSTLYNFRMSNYVQQRKTYTRKVAAVHLNCSTVPCNTLCARIAAAIDVKFVTSFVTYRVRDLGMQYPGVRHIHVNKKKNNNGNIILFFFFTMIIFLDMLFCGSG
jgi:hypothetical protein